MSRYCVTVLGGLEEIARREIRSRLPGAVLCDAAGEDAWGPVFFDDDGPPADVLTLRSIEHVFAAVDAFGDVPTDESGPEVIRARLAAVGLDEPLRLHAAIHGARENPSFRCTSKRTGEHDFSSYEIMARAGAAIVARYGWRVDLEGYDYDLHVDLVDDRCCVGLRLTPVSLHHRSRIAHTPASINPPLAYALCLLSEPQPGEVFLDPMCGAGTILIERAALGPARLLAGDLHPRPVEMAQRNFEAFGAQAGLCRWDARRLPLAGESVDKVVCNLPWGRRVGSHLSNRHLYPGFVREVARVLRVRGLAVLVSLEKRMLTRAVERHGWLRIERRLLISVGGLNPWIFVVRKFRGNEPPTAD
jgi:23S rRNA G2445 N2-methylase RlmL